MTVLLFIAMIVIFLGIDYVMQRKNKPAPAAYQTQHTNDPLRLPSGIFFAPSHTWLTLFPSGNVRIGIDDFVLRMMKNPELVLLKRAGTKVRKGEPLLQLKEGMHTITARSPIDADVVELNDMVLTHPEALRESLFSDGWAYTIRPNRTSDLTGMFLGEQSRAWIQREFGRLRDFIAGSPQDGLLAPALMQDGGVAVEGALTTFSDEECKRFEQHFLLVD